MSSEELELWKKQVATELDKLVEQGRLDKQGNVYSVKGREHWFTAELFALFTQTAPKEAGAF